MKRAIIVHCWGGYPEYCWYPYAKKGLEEMGFSVEVPAFPDTEAPKMQQWVPYLKKVIGEPDEELFLIGHSIGCAAIMRYLESLPADKKVGGVVLVAGFTDNLGFEEIRNFFETPIDFVTIGDRSKRGFMTIHSDNDPYVPLKHADILKEKFGAEVIIKHKAGHFSGATDGEESCFELPEVIESIETLSTKK